MYVVGNPILNDEKCVIQLAFPPYTIVDYRSFRLYGEYIDGITDSRESDYFN